MRDVKGISVTSYKYIGTEQSAAVFRPRRCVRNFFLGDTNLCTNRCIKTYVTLTHVYIVHSILIDACNKQ